MGETMMVYIWCNECDREVDNLSGNMKYESCAELRERLREILIQRGWLISKEYGGYALCQKCVWKMQTTLKDV